MFKNSVKRYYEGINRWSRNIKNKRYKQIRPQYIHNRHRKTINNNKIHPKYSWKINNNTNWNTCKNAIENKIEYKPPANYQDLEQIVYSTAMGTIGMYKFNSNQVHNNKNIITARQQKHTAKKNYNKQSKQKVLAHKEEVQSSGSSLYKTKMNLFWWH